MIHTFPDLPYEYDALEPYIDAQTMEIHYNKHHRTYFNKFSDAIRGTELETQTLTSIFSSMSSHSAAVRNHGGGYFNHTLFWRCMSPNGGGVPTGKLAEQINLQFGDFETFQRKFSEIAINTFGSGFTWLIKTPSGLDIVSTSNQDNPLMNIAEVQGQPILALDLWEHAYYLSYQNRRPEYISAWWNVVDWDNIAAHFGNG
ncbi:MAG: superoxide dismutase [Aliivibrio sp.]|uniref:superoxide dismutase n=1 Tax=Aliivibrio sp. TaxID=1872443 RepID=UPI001A4BDB83|nr:superoxide dismutase [Aliivibrio sp.]